MAYNESKFKEFNRMLNDANGAKVVIVHHPQVLGDNYDELCENLNRLSAAEKMLAIVPPKDRVK